MRIKVTHLNTILSILAEDDAFYESVKPLADTLDKMQADHELSPEDVLVVFE